MEKTHEILKDSDELERLMNCLTDSDLCNNLQQNLLYYYSKVIPNNCKNCTELEHKTLNDMLSKFYQLFPKCFKSFVSIVSTGERVNDLTNCTEEIDYIISNCSNSNYAFKSMYLFVFFIHLIKNFKMN